VKESLQILERFLVSELVMAGSDRIRSLVGSGGASDHLPIILQIKRDDHKPVSPS